MIASVRGTVLVKNEDSAIIDVAGVGYLALVPTPVLDSLKLGTQAQLHTYLHVREQELTLFGFSDQEELNLFKLLLKVQGIGPKVALAIMSHLSSETLRQAVAKGEAALFSRVPGIGPKKAKQIVFHLKDKVVSDDVFVDSVPITDSDSEVLAALTTLGYSVIEAQTALQQLPDDARGETTEEKIRLALSSLARL